MPTVKNLKKFLYFILAVISACNELPESGYRQSSNLKMEGVIFRDVFVDESVDQSSLENVRKLLSKEEVLYSFENIGKVSGEKIINEFINQAEGHELRVIAIWSDTYKTTLSILIDNEWHVALDNHSLENGVLKIIELTPIDPSAGIE